MLRKVVSVLLVLVMLSSAVMPAMAAGNEEVYEKCSRPANSESRDVAVLEVEGLEKAFLITDILKNEDVKKLKSALNIGEIDLASAKAVKIMDTRGIAKTVVIPMKTKSGEIKLVYISAKGYVKVGAVEVFKEKDANQIRVYYVDGGEVKRYSIKEVTYVQK